MKTPPVAAVLGWLLLTGCRHAPDHGGGRSMTEQEPMNRARAMRLLSACRGAPWPFPTSLGRPVPVATPAWATALLTEKDNLARAATWLVRAGDLRSAEELAAHAWRLWVLGREEPAGRHVLATVLDGHGGGPLTRFRALALYGDSVLAFRTGDLAGSRRRAEQALGAARASADREAEGLALLGLSRVELSAGQHALAGELATASLGLLSSGGDPWTQAPLHMLAQSRRFTGSPEQTAELFARSLALNRRLRDHGMVLVELHNLGHAELRRGQVDAAQALLEEAERLSGPTGDGYELALRALNRAALAHARGRDDTARAHLADAQALIRTHQVELATDDADSLAALERQLGPQSD